MSAMARETLASSTRRKAALGGKESQEQFLTSLVQECDDVKAGIQLLLASLVEGPVLGASSQPTTEIVSKCRALHACNVKLLELLAATQPVERKKRAPAAKKSDENLTNGVARKLRSSSSNSSSSIISSSKGGGSKKAGKAMKPRAVAEIETQVEAQVEAASSLRSILTPIAASAPPAASPPSLPSNEGTPVLADWRMSGASPRRSSPSLIPAPSQSKARNDDSSMHTPVQHWAAVSSPVSSGNTPQTPQMASPLTQTLLRHPHTADKAAVAAVVAGDEPSWAVPRPAAVAAAASAAKSNLKTPQGVSPRAGSRAIPTPSLPTPAALSDSRDDDASPQMLSPPKLSTLLQPRSASRR